MRYALSDYESTAIKPTLPNKPRGVRRVNDRRLLNGIFGILSSGAPWRHPIFAVQPNIAMCRKPNSPASAVFGWARSPTCQYLRSWHQRPASSLPEMQKAGSAGSQSPQYPAPASVALARLAENPE
jgi:transposase